MKLKKTFLLSILPIFLFVFSFHRQIVSLILSVLVCVSFLSLFWDTFFTFITHAHAHTPQPTKRRTMNSFHEQFQSVLDFFLHSLFKLIIRASRRKFFPPHTPHNEGPVAFASDFLIDAIADKTWRRRSRSFGRIFLPPPSLMMIFINFTLGVKEWKTGNDAGALWTEMDGKNPCPSGFENCSTTMHLVAR